jgi:hypothetical protein
MGASAVPPWNFFMASWVPRSPMAWAAVRPTQRPRS